jgi:uncharacterized protein
MAFSSILKKKQKALFALCEQYGVIRLYAFGSVLREDFGKKSDIDLIIELSQEDPIERGEIMLTLWDKFETLFKRKVDLLSNKPIRNPYLAKEIENTKQLIYERAS